MLADLVRDVKKKLGKVNDLIIYDPNRPVEAITSRSVIIDKMTGYKGLAVKGRMVEVIGQESSGKTTLCLQSCAAVQQAGGVAVYMDYEQTYDASYGKALGLDLNNETFVVFQPQNGEEGEEILNMIWAKYNVDLIIIDSISACKPKKAFEIKPGDANQPMLHAAYWSYFVDRLRTSLHSTNTACLLINQIREKPAMNKYDKGNASNVGMGAGFSFHDTGVKTTGGTALRFYMSARYFLQLKGHLKEEVVDENDDLVEIKVANWIKIRNVKNKMAPPFTEAQFVIKYGKGTDDFLPAFVTLQSDGRISNSGKSWTYTSATEGMSFVEKMGRARFEAKLREPAYVEDILKQVLVPVVVEDGITDEDLP